MSRKINMEEKMLINGHDIDEWIEEPITTESVPYDSEPKYEKKVVAYLDLLGITREIRNKINGDEYEIISKLSKIKNIVEKEITPMNENVDMLYISDTFIFVCDVEVIERFLDMLSSVQMRILVECKTLLRGAIEYGDVSVQDEGKQIIGPAYIDAYLKQEKNAVFPRIIMSNSVLAKIGQYGKLVVSQDRESSLDYIDVYRGKKTKNELITHLRREGIFKYLRDGYQNFDKQNESSIRSKYAWTINYLREKGVWPDEREYHCW